LRRTILGENQSLAGCDQKSIAVDRVAEVEQRLPVYADESRAALPIEIENRKSTSERTIAKI
jgi:hypothetical protein